MSTSTSSSSDAAVAGEFLARALGTVLAARIGGPLVVSSSDSGSSSGEERLWVRERAELIFRRLTPCIRSFVLSLTLLHSLELSDPVQPRLTAAGSSCSSRGGGAELDTLRNNDRKLCRRHRRSSRALEQQQPSSGACS